jgi:C4-dicarboxylate-specific signal transduction histidine kinase
MVLQSLFIVRLIKMHGNQKVLNKKIIEAENQYRQLYREDRILRLGNLTASLSHELNQPLTAILSMAQVGIRFIDSNNADPEMMKEIFLNIVDDDKRAASIIAVVRGMVKHEKREKEKVNLNNIIKQVLELFRRSSVEMKSSIYVEPANRPIYIIADAIQMQQVLMNLISNAQQSIEKTEYPNKTIIIDQSLENGTVTVSVRDFGKGIDDSIKNTLFKPFSTSRKEGLGFGLAICRSIIEDHQGTIWAENMPDGGAKFSFKLKIHEC